MSKPIASRDVWPSNMVATVVTEHTAIKERAIGNSCGFLFLKTYRPILHKAVKSIPIENATQSVYESAILKRATYANGNHTTNAMGVIPRGMTALIWEPIYDDKACC